MALNTHEPIVSASTAAPPILAHKPKHRPLRIMLVLLEALMAVTTIQGALFVVPTLPSEWLHNGLIAPFADYMVPALVLGILCGGAALVALTTVLARPKIGAVVSIVAGALMVGFELVEIAVVGFTPALYPTLPPAWLQPFYIVVGTAIALLGARLWEAEADS